jgi:predicted ArsR family transcriptional regulator
MPKTIRELADELNVSKQTIQYHYQRLPAKNQQKNSQGTNLISPTAERIIRGKVAKPLLAKKQQRGSKESPKTSKENNELVATLRSEVEDLKFQRDKQLATKDQQISSKDRQIDHLTKLIDQQQQLQLATVAENRQLKKNVRKLSDLLNPSSSTRKQQANDREDTFSNDNNTIYIKDKNANQAKKEAVETHNKKRTIYKNRANKSWWHFW